MFKRIYDFNDTIGVFPNALTQGECDAAIQHFEDNIENTFEGETAGGVRHDYKNTRDLTMWDGHMFDLFCVRSNEYVDKYLEGYGKLTEWDPFCLFNEGSHYPSWQIQRYIKNEGHYNAWHTEEPHLKKFCKRMFVVMYYLNDVTEGGTTDFLYTDFKVTPKAGTFCIWPAGFPYVHRGSMPISNNKYIATTWLLSNHGE